MKAVTIVGKCSTFGGRKDTGVKPSEGLAVIPDDGWRQAIWRSLFTDQHDDSLGLARNLDPNAHYCAMRWDYDKTPRVVLAHSIVRVVAEDGTTVWCRPADWGPNIRTGRVIDLSPGAAQALGVKTDARVQATLITPETLLA